MLPEKRAEIAGWLRKADDDLRAAGHDLQATPPLVEDSLFHCQQAAEKAIKGFLTFHDRPFRKTHDLDELAALCLQIDPSLESALEPVREFTVFAWIFRYPGERAAPPAEECGSLLTLAARVVGAVRERVCLD